MQIRDLETSLGTALFERGPRQVRLTAFGEDVAQPLVGREQLAHMGGHALELLDQQHARHRIGLLVHGAADGADTIAERWAKKRQVMYLGVPAPWALLGRSAGPRRARPAVAQQAEALKPSQAVSR